VRAVGASVAGLLGFRRHAPEELASLLRAEYSADEVHLCASGTDALQVAIESARNELGRDAIVALPAFSCFDVASAAIGAAGPFALYDIEPESLAPDLSSLDRALTLGARIAVVAPLYGIPVDWNTLEALASTHGALLIEDAAQGHGASYRNAPLGSLGDISTLSFGRGKGWTGGAGGAVLFRDRKVSGTEQGRVPVGASIGTAARLAVQWGLGRPWVYGLPRRLPGLSLGETVYHDPRPAMPMGGAIAAAVLASRKASLRESGLRRENAEWLRNLLGEQPALRAVACRAGADGLSGYLRFPVLAREGMRGFREPAAAVRLGVAQSYPAPLATLPRLAPLIVGQSEWPGAKQLSAKLITLPAHSLLSKRDRARLADQVRGYGAR
jgi:dTDP-4-amino-4,6-dideoxygalactose transaminase